MLSNDSGIFNDKNMSKKNKQQRVIHFIRAVKIRMSMFWFLRLQLQLQAA